MKQSLCIVGASALSAVMIEAAAFFIGIAFTGVKDFGPLWPLAAVYYLGLFPAWFLPDLPSAWKVLYLIAPIVFWTLTVSLIANGILFFEATAKLGHFPAKRGRGSALP